MEPKTLLIIGDASETVDTLYPYYRLIEGGYRPVVAAPEKRRYQMVLHEVKAGWTITKEWEGYTIDADIATPLIAHWPAGIAAKNEVRRQPAHLIDIMATCVDVAGAVPPKELNGQPITPLEGRSLVPAFAGKPIERDELFWEHEGNAAVRAGDMKLVRAGRNGAWELYDLAKDRTEQHDLAAEQPDKATKLAAMWEAWAGRAQVKPYPVNTGQKGAGKNQGDREATEPKL